MQNSIHCITRLAVQCKHLTVSRQCREFLHCQIIPAKKILQADSVTSRAEQYSLYHSTSCTVQTFDCITPVQRIFALPNNSCQENSASRQRDQPCSTVFTVSPDWLYSTEHLTVSRQCRKFLYCQIISANKNCRHKT